MQCLLSLKLTVAMFLVFSEADLCNVSGAMFLVSKADQYNVSCVKRISAMFLVSEADLCNVSCFLN